MLPLLRVPAFGVAIMGTVAKVLSELYADEKLRSNCSGFFKALVNGKLQMNMPDLQADALINYITVTGNAWVEIGNGPAKGVDAANYAAKGYLVVALLKAADHQPHKDGTPYTHGHMAIVLPDVPPANGYPFVVSGSIAADGQSDGSKRVYEKGIGRSVWRAIDAPNVKYYRTTQTFDLLQVAGK
jgi:hypothetical protein